MAHPGGAPRTTSFSPQEMIALGEEMLEWIKENQPLHLSAWYSIHKAFTGKQWEAFQQLPEFHPYYERALLMIGQQYLDKNSNVNPGISQRWQRVYFKDLKRQEDQDLDDAAKRGSQVPDSTESQKELLMAMLEMIKDKQSKKNDCC